MGNRENVLLFIIIMGSVFFVFLKNKENVNLIKEIYDNLFENLFKNDGVVGL